MSHLKDGDERRMGKYVPSSLASLVFENKYLRNFLCDFSGPSTEIVMRFVIKSHMIRDWKFSWTDNVWLPPSTTSNMIFVGKEGLFQSKIGKDIWYSLRDNSFRSQVYFTIIEGFVTRARLYSGSLPERCLISKIDPRIPIPRGDFVSTLISVNLKNMMGNRHSDTIERNFHDCIVYPSFISSIGEDYGLQYWLWELSYSTNIEQAHLGILSEDLTKYQDGKYIPLEEALWKNLMVNHLDILKVSGFEGLKKYVKETNDEIRKEMEEGGLEYNYLDGIADPVDIFEFDYLKETGYLQ